MNDEKKGTIHNIEVGFKGHRFDAITHDVTLPNGHRTKWDIVHTAQAVAVLPVSGDMVVLLKNYRHAVGKWILELPAGMLEKDENPVECAQRELLEETGYESKNFEKICEVYPSPGFTDEVVHIYTAEIDHNQKGQVRLDGAECIEVLTLPAERLFEMVRGQKIFDGKTVLALLWLENRIKQ